MFVADRMEAFTNFLSDFYNDVTDWLNIPRGELRTGLKWAYWILGLAGLLGICYVLYNRFEKPVASILLFIGGWMLLMYYWVKWFKLTEKNPSWPPFIKPCPDFLTLLLPETEEGISKCVDYVGVSAPNAPHPLKKASPSSIQTQINNPEYYYAPPKDTKTTSVYDICQGVRDRGLVWSGVCPE